MVNYRDTINQFSINIPAEWKYGTNKSIPSLVLLAHRTPESKSETIRDNFNINVINTPNKDLNQTFTFFLRSISVAGNFRIIETGDTIINGSRFKWVIESHKNENNGTQMHNYIFVTVKDDKTYILTMITFSEAFLSVKSLFNQIAYSFSLLN